MQAHGDERGGTHGLEEAAVRGKGSTGRAHAASLSRNGVFGTGHEYFAG
ncbi:hypothetical protein A176_005980 [Myxococcus hansupus]|uniref:Uncharacterized protein n=1 Tax=Pseudomyxococcus hansupus TaxID=1297742 RepID=A0A0H4X5E2_9BACT|nr:hypothetical protein A176_005980 [Myxococcus hansupus]